MFIKPSTIFARILLCYTLLTNLTAMKKISLKKIAYITAGITLTLTLVLVVHIYLVTRPDHKKEQQRVMARIDFKQDIAPDDAKKITTWLYMQKGVDHVLCNDATNIAVFTFSPEVNNANNIISSLISSTSYKAERYMPSQEDMRSGCPVVVGSVTDKIYNLFKHM